MPSSQYLYRRPSGIYFVRLCVPKRLKSAVGKGEIHRSTGCRDYRLAKIVAAELSAHWHRAIETLKHMDIRKLKAGSIKLLGDDYISLVDAAIELGSQPLALAHLIISQNSYFFVEATGWLGWPVSDIYESVDQSFDEMGQPECVIDDVKLGGLAAQIKFNGHLRIRFEAEAVAVLRTEAPVYICMFMHGLSPVRGFVCDLPGQHISTKMLYLRKIDVVKLCTALVSQVTPQMEAAAYPPPRALPAVEPESCSELKFSAFIKDYFKRKCGNLKTDQRRRRQDQCNIFMDLMGDLSMAKITRPLLRQFSDLIAKIPDERHNVRRKFKCPQATFKDLIALAEQHSLPRLTINAQHRLLDGMSEIFNWAIEETVMVNNPAYGLGGEAFINSGKLKIKPQDQRDALSNDDLNRIFLAKWFVNGTGEKTAVGKFYAYRPHYFWLPLLALYGGGRINELSQLYLNDVKKIHGVDYLDFNLEGENKKDADDPDIFPSLATDKSLKTVNSARIIPIHQKLLDLDFLGYVEALRASGYTRLFPELKFDANKGYGKAAGKWFNERFLGIELEIPRNGRKTFHSMRHNFATALGIANIAANVKSDLMGHARKGALVDLRYDKGVLNELKTHIDRIDYLLPPIATFNICEGVEAVKDALKLKISRTGLSKI